MRAREFFKQRYGVWPEEYGYDVIRDAAKGQVEFAEAYVSKAAEAAGGQDWRHISEMSADALDSGADPTERADAWKEDIPWNPEIERVRKELMKRFSGKLSMEEIASFAYETFGAGLSSQEGK